MISKFLITLHSYILGNLFLTEVLLNETITLTVQWIAKDGLSPWPSLSPNITSLDVFLWGHVIVYRIKIQAISNLKQKITGAIATTDEAMLQR